MRTAISILMTGMLCWSPVAAAPGEAGHQHEHQGAESVPKQPAAGKKKPAAPEMPGHGPGDHGVGHGASHGAGMPAQHHGSGAGPDAGMGGHAPHQAPGGHGGHGMELPQGAVIEVGTPLAVPKPSPLPPDTLEGARQCHALLLSGRVMVDEGTESYCMALVARRGGGGKVVTVRMITDAKGANRFEPARVVIRRGDTVQWVVESGAHNSVSYPERIPYTAQPFEGPMLAQPGQSWSRAFFNAGTHEYHCHPHEALGMRGVVIVERESRPGEFRALRKGEEGHAHH